MATLDLEYSGSYDRRACVFLQECNAHIRLQMQHLAESQAVEATAFLEQVYQWGMVFFLVHGCWLPCAQHTAFATWVACI